MNYIISFFFFIINLNVLAQSFNGVTNKKDTSYTTNSAFLNSKKQYPFITIAKEIFSDSLIAIKNIKYCKKAKHKLKLDIFSSTQNIKKINPCIVIIHGGGWRSGNRNQHYPLAQSLALKGYVCATVEYRLSTEALYPAPVIDIKTAIKFLKKRSKYFNIDTNKIAVLGFSAGGQLAALIGNTPDIEIFKSNNYYTKYSDKVQAIIDIDGILSFTHPQSAEGDDSKKISAATYWFGFPKLQNPKIWNQASALNYAGKFSPPTLFLNSSIERMHAGRDDYIKILNENNIFSEVHTFENSPHSFCIFNPWFNLTINYIDEFLMKIFNEKHSNF